MGYFYGMPFSSIDVSTNGSLNFSGDTAFNNTPLPTTVTRICLSAHVAVNHGTSYAELIYYPDAGNLPSRIALRVGG